MNNRGISLIALVISIIVMVILASIVFTVSFDSLDEATMADINIEIRNIMEVISSAKVKIATGDFVPNEIYLASRGDMENLGFSGETISYVESVNNDVLISLDKKYYLLDQAAFKDEFGDNINVSGLKRNYLVTYDDRIVMLVVNGVEYSSDDVLSGE